MARHTVGKEKQKENNLFSGFSLADRGTQKRKEKRRIEKQKDNKIYFLEINSQPGMTKLSLLPEQAKFKKISFENIIRELINNSK